MKLGKYEVWPLPSSFGLLSVVGHGSGLLHHASANVVPGEKRFPVHRLMRLLCCAPLFMNDMLEMEMMGVESAEGNVDVVELQTPWPI